MTTEPTITMTVKEAEELQKELTDTQAKLATALAEKAAAEKVAAEKTAAPAITKVAEDVLSYLGEQKMLTVTPEVKEAMAKDGGILRCFKTAVDLYKAAEDKRKIAEDKLKEIPNRVGRPARAEKVAGEKSPTPLEAASTAFATRVLAAAAK